MPCLAAKPVVDGFEKELDGRAEVVRLDVSDEVGRQVARSYDVRGVPTSVVLRGDGEVAYRQTGMPSRKKVVAAVSGAA